MRGREAFAQHKKEIYFLSSIMIKFPQEIRTNLLLRFRNTKGLAGLVIRYCIIKSLATSSGDNISIHPNVYIFKPERLLIGNNVSIHPMCYIDATGIIEIGNDVSIAHDVSIISFNHNYNELEIPIKDQDITAERIKIGDNVWIGAKATILSGVTIGRGSVIGAGSVVTHDVEENSVVVGVPAKIIKKRD